MITLNLIKSIEEFVYAEVQKYYIPSKFHIQMTNQIGRELACKLGGDKDVILLGTLLMDCLIGEARHKNQLGQHVEMSANKTCEFLKNASELTDEERRNVLACVKEHHGVKNFYSIEAEICCNADCYKFLTIQGVTGGIHGYGHRTLEELIELYRNKLEEKWQILTLPLCKEELKPQYQALKQFFNQYKKYI